MLRFDTDRFWCFLKNRYFLEYFWLFVMCSVCFPGLFILFTWFSCSEKFRIFLRYDLVRMSCKWSGLFSIFPDFYSDSLSPFFGYFLMHCIIQLHFWYMYALSYRFSFAKSFCPIHALVSLPTRYHSYVKLRIKSYRVQSLLFCLIVIRHILHPSLEPSNSSLDTDK